MRQVDILEEIAGWTGTAAERKMRQRYAAKPQTRGFPHGSYR